MFVGVKGDGKFIVGFVGFWRNDLMEFNLIKWLSFIFLEFDFIECIEGEMNLFVLYENQFECGFFWVLFLELEEVMLDKIFKFFKFDFFMMFIFWVIGVFVEIFVMVKVEKREEDDIKLQLGKYDEFFVE